MTAREYFDNNVVFAVEVEYSDGGRDWSHYRGKRDLHDALTSIEACGSMALSDVDYNGSQEDYFCEKVLKLADLNFWKNPEWVKRNNLKSYDDVIYFILDNELYKA